MKKGEQLYKDSLLWFERLSKEMDEGVDKDIILKCMGDVTKRLLELHLKKVVDKKEG